MWSQLAAALFGGAVFVAIGGGHILDPARTSWLLYSDWGYHFIAWLFFRQAPWQWPLGAIPNLFHPIGTTVGYNDGIPWLAVLAKLASPVLPRPAQYVGPWLGLCFVLQGWFGARLARTVGARSIAAALGGALFALAPVLLFRVNHEALCAHWLLLWALALALERAPRVWEIVLVPALAMGIHPYLSIMVLAFASVAAARRGRRVGGAAAAAAAALTFGVAVLFGYIGPTLDDIEGTGFGRYASDLLALVNPLWLSRLMPELASHSAEAEGYAWLGLGVLALGASALPLLARDLPWRRVAPVIAVAGLFTIFAWSSSITILGRPILDVSFLYRPFHAVTGAFRSSGRFIWPLVYLLGAGAIAVWCARRPRWAPFALAAALALQAADSTDPFQNHFYAWPKVKPPAEELVRAHPRHVVLYPPRCGDGSHACCPGFTPPPKKTDFVLATQVAMLGATLNSGGASRVFRSRFAGYCAELQRQVHDGELDREAIYLVAGERMAEFRKGNPKALCRPMWGEMGCVPQDTTPELRQLMWSLR